MIAVWIEASWLFGAPPELIFTGSQSKIKQFLRSIPPEQLRQFKIILADMRTLSSDLQALNASWRHVLQAEPNEIWQPSISAFQQSDFWTHIPCSSFLSIGQSSEDEDELAVLCSQLSLDGSRIGIVKCDQTGFWIHTQRIYYFRYEIWTMDSNTLFSTFDISLELWDWKEREAIVISHDLSKVCLHLLLLKFDVTRRYNSTQERKYPLDTLRRGLPSEFAYSFRYIVPSWRRSISPDRRNYNPGLLKVNDAVRQEWHNGKFTASPTHKHFSPNGEFILAVVESTGLLTVDQDPTTSARVWVAEVFRDTCRHLKDISLDHQSLTHYFPPSGTKIEWLDREVAFHPCLPQLALSRFDDTCLWHLNKSVGGW
jgi:hypothetical protein